ncbi:MAG: hypothetical protein MJB14_09855 [Spirochaetes bacterium]|nr:hypothetical protein [Spirochaetota bacterium]
MKNKFLISLVWVFFCTILFGNENIKVEIIDGDKSFEYVENQDEDIKVFTDEESLAIMRSKNYLKLGKKLTNAAVTGLIFGVSCTGLGFFTGTMALYVSGSLPLISTMGWSGMLSSLWANIGYMSPAFYALAGATIMLWTVGFALSALIFLIIPGIIFWAKGANLKVKKNMALSPLKDQVGFAIRL